jgi:hypothetical protein
LIRVVVVSAFRETLNGERGVLRLGGAEFDTHVPHWFGNPGPAGGG